jgi:hypothetical protein
MDRTSDREGGWSNLVAFLEERYASGGETTHRIAEDNDRPIDPALVSALTNIARLPTHDDYPFWRVRCEVTDSGYLPRRV